MSDWMAVLVSFAYVFAMIAIAEALRRWRRYTVEFTRKFIHVSVGMWVYGAVLLFERREMALIPALAFVVINLASHRWNLFKSMELAERGRLGTVYFPLSFAALVWILWDRPDLLVASLMPMTWGDGAAAVLGRAYGKHQYAVLGAVRSVEGSIVMFGFSWLATVIPLALLSQRVDWASAIAPAALVALGATLVEAVSPWGLDNLTVPAVSALLLAILL
jgi:phytol kinase